MNFDHLKKTPLVIAVLATFLVVMHQLDGLKMMPGDIGDARLNNYFLENIFQFVKGNSDSLWNLSFFAPYPYVLGFSDNLFGTSPIYIVARLLNYATDTAYQLWFVFGYIANFGAAYYALRKLNAGILAATVGALIFSFSLPTSTHAGHAQLHYRFGLPLALVYFVDFLNLRVWSCLLIAGAWLVFQFYAGIYIGFFTLLLMATMAISYLMYVLIKRRAYVREDFKGFYYSWQRLQTSKKTILIGGFVFLLLLLALLFYPYLQVSRLYNFKRSWDEISTMLPRPQSYFLADNSILWSSPKSQIFSDIPMRHEHQMFIGLIPLMLALIGFFLGSRDKNGLAFTLMTGMLGMVLLLTLNIGGYSLWFFLYKLPLASAIRAITRLDQAVLFPIAYLATVSIDNLVSRCKWSKSIVIILIIPLVFAESIMTKMKTSQKDYWRERLSALESAMPANLPEKSILFFAQRSGPFFADELDAMWLSLNNHSKTMNGYSGNYPPGFRHEYGNDCTEVPKRVLAFQEFIGRGGDDKLYKDLMSRIVPVDFLSCDPSWLVTMPKITSASKKLAIADISKIKYGLGTVNNSGNTLLLNFKIINQSDITIPALSTVGSPIRISWRFNDINGRPLSGWDPRLDLPFDIPAHGSLNVPIVIKKPLPALTHSMSISLVHEGEFWAHDIGVDPLTYPIVNH